MGLWVNTRGRATLAVAICDRCRLKAAHSDLVPDPNNQGLRVHQHCADVLDPYRLPPRKAENVSLPWVRPETPVEE